MLIIAEIGQNHNGDMDLARRLVTAASEVGADIAKFQLFDVEKVFPLNNPKNEQRKRSQLSQAQVGELAAYCEAQSIEFMASVFDVERVGWCRDIGMKRFKIASRSIYDKELIDAIAATGRDIIASLGMYKEAEFPHIVTTGRVDFLYCVAKYPTRPEDLDFLHADFSRYAGYSDHTVGTEACKIALARGAGIIEKHFTLDKNLPGPDHAHSALPDELAEIVAFARACRSILYHE